MRCLDTIGRIARSVAERLLVDTADGISADYIADRMARAEPGTIVVVDYLQLLDQRRQNPPLGAQLTTLKAFAAKRGSTVVCLSQIDRNFEPGTRKCPGLGDVRLPNPIDLGLFDRACFLHAGRMELVPGRAG